ncbi:tyrosine-type recombinase/integrase [Aliarcobacter butzleri]|uniref:tyrosine-type recombinase/integrase n=1 Tax=Aliarcobacter butzleri TaxID=28197 RepID=UPI0018721F41
MNLCNSNTSSLILNRTVIYTLKHTFASHLAINRIPIFTIKELMNHSDIEQTMRYANYS